MRLPVCILLVLLCALGCEKTTGGLRVTFRAAAAGPDDAPPGEFINARGYHVVLNRAVLYIGALYLNQTTSGATVGLRHGCYASGTYAAQVLGGLNVDLLSPALQFFPVEGEGTSTRALAAEVWLNGSGRVDQIDDQTVILDIAGVAERGSNRFPFAGTLTIAQNRVIPPQIASTPGVNPICKQRIIAPIPIDITPANGGLLVLRVDAYDLFAATDFAQLNKVSDTPLLYRFSNKVDNTADQNVYGNMRTPRTYQFEWQSNDKTGGQ